MIYGGIGSAAAPCMFDWDAQIPAQIWVPAGANWNEHRETRVTKSWAMALRWLESFVQMLDVIENTSGSSETLYWDIFPGIDIAARKYFGPLDPWRFVVIRERAHKMLLIMTGQNPDDDVIWVYAGVAETGSTLCDVDPVSGVRYDAWSLSGIGIGFCLHLLDEEDTEENNDSIARMVLHEVAHQAGAGHAAPGYCTGGKQQNQCRSESECLQLAEQDPSLTVMNADSYRYAIYRHGNAPSWCHPYWETLTLGSGNQDDALEHGFGLCTHSDPLDASSTLLCKPKILCPLSNLLLGSNTFKVCDAD